MFDTVLLITLCIIIILVIILIISIVFYFKALKNVFAEKDEIIEITKASFQHAKELEIKLYNLRKNVDELSTILSTKYTKK